MSLALHRAIESSWHLLSNAERRAVAQCSVFRGSFTLDALDAVIDRPPEYDETLDFVQALREKSLLARTEKSSDQPPARGWK